MVDDFHGGCGRASTARPASASPCASGLVLPSIYRARIQRHQRCGRSDAKCFSFVHSLPYFAASQRCKAATSQVSSASLTKRTSKPWESNWRPSALMTVLRRSIQSSFHSSSPPPCRPSSPSLPHSLPPSLSLCLCPALSVSACLRNYHLFPFCRNTNKCIFEAAITWVFYDDGMPLVMDVVHV